MLLPADDYPIHQTALPVAHAMDGHPNAYDRYWFNGYTEDSFFAFALGLYPNRGVIDAAFSVVDGDEQYSVFASDALVGRPTSVGPLRLDIIEPLRVNHLEIDAPEQGLRASLTYTQRCSTIEEPRQTMHDGARIFMDVTRATQLGTWSGWYETPGGRHEVIAGTYGTKDRSWGVRPVGEPLPGAPSERAPQLCFWWAPLHVADGGVHAMAFEDATGRSVSRSGSVVGYDAPARSVDASLDVTLEPGTRWLREATLHVDGREISLSPLLRFQMRGAGYSHPQYGHGRWHGGPVVAGEVLTLSALDPLEYSNVHVQHVVRTDDAGRVGLGVLEQLTIGPHEPTGLRDLLDGA